MPDTYSHLFYLKPISWNQLLGEHFILHKPKEIVSGDFYWVSGTGIKQLLLLQIVQGMECPVHL